MWSALCADRPSPRSEIVVNIDDISNYAAIRRGDFKYVICRTDMGDAWYGETGRPEFNNNGGTLSTYDAEVILKSKAGVALAGVITARQVEEVKRMREGGLPSSQTTTRMLTAADIQSLRTKAVLNCNVKEEDKVACNPLESPCLFNVKEDPCEMINLAKTRPLIVATLEEALMRYRLTAIPASNVDMDPRADPVHWNRTWVNWNDPHPMKLTSNEFGRPRRISGPAIAMIAVLLAAGAVALIAVVTIKFKKNTQTATHPEHGLYTVPTETSTNSNDSKIVEEPIEMTGQKSRSLQSFKELASLKDLARNID